MYEIYFASGVSNKDPSISMFHLLNESPVLENYLATFLVFNYATKELFQVQMYKIKRQT